MLAFLALIVAAATPAGGNGPSAPAATSAAAEPPVASDGLRILVVAPGASDVRVEELYSGLRAAGLQPVDLDERGGIDREPSSSRARPGVRDEARARLQEAKARFRDLEIDGTRAALDAAIDEVLRLQRPEDALDTLVDALLLRASIALQAGVEDEARTALVLLSRLEPDRAELHPGLYAPSLVDAYAAARADEQARGEGALVVRPRVAGFRAPELVVDGRPAAVGTALPLRLGPHLVTVRTHADGAGDDDALPFSQIVDVGQAPIALEPFLAPADAPDRRATLVATARDAVDATARARAFADLAPLCAARAVLYVDDTTASLWVPGKPVEALRLPPTWDGALVGRATLATLQAPVRKDPRIVPPVEEPLDTTTIVLLASVGAVLVAGAIAVGLYTLTDAADIKPPPPPVDPICCTF